MKTAFGSAKYASLFDTKDDVANAMRFYGDRILAFSEHELKSKVEGAVRRMEFPNLSEILDLELEEWETRCHKAFVPFGPMLEDKTTKEAKLEERKSLLAKLREDTGI